jgi:hypothetical protein
VRTEKSKTGRAELLLAAVSFRLGLRPRKRRRASLAIRVFSKQSHKTFGRLVKSPALLRTEKIAKRNSDRFAKGEGLGLNSPRIGLHEGLITQGIFAHLQACMKENGLSSFELKKDLLHRRKPNVGTAKFLGPHPLRVDQDRDPITAITLRDFIPNLGLPEKARIIEFMCKKDKRCFAHLFSPLPKKKHLKEEGYSS